MSRTTGLGEQQHESSAVQCQIVWSCKNAPSLSGSMIVQCPQLPVRSPVTTIEFPWFWGRRLLRETLEWV